MADITFTKDPAPVAPPQTFTRDEPKTPAPEKVYYNELEQPFTLSGAPVPAQPSPSESFTGSYLPIRRDESGLHPAVPEAIAAPIRGMISGGQRALGVGEAGQNPLRPLSGDELAATMAAGPLAAPISKMPTPSLAPPPAAIISQERASLAKEARDVFNIPVTAPQIGTGQMLKTASSAIEKLPLSGARPHEAELRESWNRELAKSFGEDDVRQVTPEVMSRAKKRIGGEMNRIENSNKVSVGDPAFINDLATIEANARAGLTDQEYAVVKRLLDGVIRNVAPGDKLEGTTYGNLLHRNSPLDQGAGNSNSNISKAAQSMKTALQDALERSLSGSDLADYRLARFQYKNMKTVEPLVKKAPTGDLSPALLNGEVSKNFPNRAFDTTGTNPLDRLAKIGQAFLREPASSQTAERGATMATLAKLGEMGALIASGHFLGIPETLGGAGAALGAGRAIGSYLRSPGLAERTIDRALHPRPPGPGFPPSSELAYRSFPGGVLSDRRDQASDAMGLQ